MRERADIPYLLWRIALFGMLFICLALASLLWLSGDREMRAAFEDGRRFLITIENGEIKGRKIEATDALQSATPKPAAPAPVAALPAIPKGDLAETTPTIIPAADATPGVNPALAEKTAQGTVPMIGADGTQPWRYYARPADNSSHLPMVAIIVTGLGYTKTASDAAGKLPAAVTLSFSPYAKNAVSWAGSARAMGHEIMMDLPLEPAGFPASDPGPYGLLIGKGAQENMSRLEWVMSRFSAYTGFVTAPSEVFTTDSRAFKPLADALAARGLLLVLAHPPVKADTTQLIADSKLASAAADMVVDEDLSADAIGAHLANLEDLAKKRGSAVGIAQAFPVSITQLAAWSAQLSERGVLLVPLSAIIKQKAS